MVFFLDNTMNKELNLRLRRLVREEQKGIRLKKVLDEKIEKKKKLEEKIKYKEREINFEFFKRKLQDHKIKRFSTPISGFISPDVYSNIMDGLNELPVNLNSIFWQGNIAMISKRAPLLGYNEVMEGMKSIGVTTIDGVLDNLSALGLASHHVWNRATDLYKNINFYTGSSYKDLSWKFNHFFQFYVKPAGLNKFFLRYLESLSETSFYESNKPYAIKLSDKNSVFIDFAFFSSNFNVLLNNTFQNFFKIELKYNYNFLYLNNKKWFFGFLNNSKNRWTKNYKIFFKLSSYFYSLNLDRNLYRICNKDCNLYLDTDIKLCKIGLFKTKYERQKSDLRKLQGKYESHMTRSRLPYEVLGEYNLESYQKNLSLWDSKLLILFNYERGRFIHMLERNPIYVDDLIFYINNNPYFSKVLKYKFRFSNDPFFLDFCFQQFFLLILREFLVANFKFLLRKRVNFFSHYNLILKRFFIKFLGFWKFVFVNFDLKTFFGVNLDINFYQHTNWDAKFILNFFYRPKVFSYYFSALLSSSPLSKIFFLMNIRGNPITDFNYTRYKTLQDRTLNYLRNEGFIWRRKLKSVLGDNAVIKLKNKLFKLKKVKN